MLRKTDHPPLARRTQRHSHDVSR